MNECDQKWARKEIFAVRCTFILKGWRPAMSQFTKAAGAASSDARITVTNGK
jgi:hypothetical protein